MNTELNIKFLDEVVIPNIEKQIVEISINHRLLTSLIMAERNQTKTNEMIGKQAQLSGMRDEMKLKLSIAKDIRKELEEGKFDV